LLILRTLQDDGDPELQSRSQNVLIKDSEAVRKKDHMTVVMRPKDPPPMVNKLEFVYSILCKDCK